VIDPDGEPSSVTFAPRELDPFQVRCEFRFVEDDNGERRFWLVGGPALEERPTLGDPIEITPALAREFEEKRARYRNLAACLVEVNCAKALDVRRAMLAASARERDSSRRPWTRLQRLDLALEYKSRLGEYGLLDALGFERRVTRFEIRRQLKAAAAAGDLPGGYPPLRPAK
jgi:hypothetical protein